MVVCGQCMLRGYLCRGSNGAVKKVGPLRCSGGEDGEMG